MSKSITLKYLLKNAMEISKLRQSILRTLNLVIDQAMQTLLQSMK